MNIAHIIGEHDTAKPAEFASHMLLSWLGIIIAVLLVVSALYYLYRRLQPALRKERIGQ